jgi:cation diffusion facilitator CzcD-associated flavoprotein CzcO
MRTGLIDTLIIGGGQAGLAMSHIKFPYTETS